MSSDVPDWLNELAPRSDEETQADVEDAEANDIDLMSDLRSQMETSEETETNEPRRTARRRQNRQLELNLLPWQRFFLSILLFLDVTVVGLLFLVMLGRITIPVS